MTPAITLTAIAVYFLLLFLISWASGRRKSDYYGGRQNSWLLAAIASMGAPISGVTFISVPGMVIAKDWSYLQMSIGFIVGYFIIAYVLVPLFYKRNLVSIYGYLDERFGNATHGTGAWFFFISKILGASVRFFVVCIVLQSLVFGPVGIPFAFNVLICVALICLYTIKGGVKAVIWTDVLKSVALIGSVVLSIVFIASSMGLNLPSMFSKVAQEGHTRIFFFDDPKSGIYFWKQFLSAVFIVVAMTGLDQDLMQRNLSCRNYKESQKSLIVSSFTQTLITAMFLILGSLLMIWYKGNLGDPAALESSDNLFSSVATANGMPMIVGVLFIVGLVAAATSAAASALTALTTSFMVDIIPSMKIRSAEGKANDRRRQIVHCGMALCMAIVIVVFNAINSQDAISAVYSLASYTYGPILGLFAFGMFTKRKVVDLAVPFVCIAAPFICLGVKAWLLNAFGYVMSFELLLLNAGLTIAGLAIFSKKQQ